jgi:uncharacterized protein
MEVVNNKKHFRFEVALSDGSTAWMEYRWLRGNIVLMHTIVPASARGKGVGSFLVKYVLDDIRARNLKAVIYCPFVTKYLQQHPEYNDIVANPAT